MAISAGAGLELHSTMSRVRRWLPSATTLAREPSLHRVVHGREYSCIINSV